SLERDPRTMVVFSRPRDESTHAVRDDINLARSDISATRDVEGLFNGRHKCIDRRAFFVGVERISRMRTVVSLCNGVTYQREEVLPAFERARATPYAVNKNHRRVPQVNA